MQPLVAVSQAIYGDKSKYCWKDLTIVNRANGKSVVAKIVDFCPTNGCNWQKGELANNVDIYGQATWNLLGGGNSDGVMDIQVTWPDVKNATPTYKFQTYVLLISLLLLSVSV